MKPRDGCDITPVLHSVEDSCRCHNPPRAQQATTRCFQCKSVSWDEDMLETRCAWLTPHVPARPHLRFKPLGWCVVICSDLRTCHSPVTVGQMKESRLAELNSSAGDVSPVDQTHDTNTRTTKSYLVCVLTGQSWTGRTVDMPREGPVVAESGRGDR